MAENLQGDAAVVTELTCGICLEDSTDPLNLPCGHTFCEGCLDEWRSRYGVDEEMRTKCPMCRARIPPSKEMVKTLLSLRAMKQKLEDDNNTSSELYGNTCRCLKGAEDLVGSDWDGVTVLEDKNKRKPPVVMPDYIFKATGKGDIKAVLRWINANRTEDRVNAVSSGGAASMSALCIAAVNNQSALMTQLLQLGANVDGRASSGITATSYTFGDSEGLPSRNGSEKARLLLSWGASFFPESVCSREFCISSARKYGKHELANLLESELGGRRCEIVNLSVQPELNGKTCVADEYLPDSNQYRVTLETKSKEVLVLSPEHLKRRDRTPDDCGYYIEFKNGRTIQHDFDSSQDCQAFVLALEKGDAQPVVTEETAARAEQVAAELLAELELDDPPDESSKCCKTKTSKKKKGGKKKRKKKNN
ncbi:hypothetical protein THAOC_31492 [Thalassiosira oceanica]|uniref:RING-type domain-containing protein n=1 Tax=Thalassiosira oceanica TaxID=159749 RepID=K0R959_THAOC|nr:hypothetical protein THAOC_31492 [Thalassiosira oceanica]|eukprot:EJK49615.1 hypothetical protein THAOC_31492 [Thalassiosira oceanica]